MFDEMKKFRLAAWVLAIASTLVFWWWSNQIIRAYDYRYFVIITTVVTTAILLLFLRGKNYSMFRYLLIGATSCYVIGLVVNTMLAFMKSDGGMLSAFSKTFSSWQHLLFVLAYPILLGTLFHGANIALSTWLFFRERHAASEV